MKVKGPSALERLLAAILEKRLESLGCGISKPELGEAMRCAVNGLKFEKKMGNLTIATGRPTRRDLTVEVAPVWKISLSYQGDGEGGSVSVFSKEEVIEGGGEGWYCQNLPDGSAAKVLVATHRRQGETNQDMAYVCRSSHMFGGLLWDLSADQPAETAYYPSGNVNWIRRHQNGLAKGRTGLPVFEKYWENGRPCIVEFGNDQIGISRPVQEGPSYAEFYSSGHPAVEIYSERRWSESEGCSVLLPTWKAHYFDQLGRRTTRAVLIETVRAGGSLSEEERRDIEDRGENRRDERIFVENHTQSIRLRDCSYPEPLFVASCRQAPLPPLVSPRGLGRGQPVISSPNPSHSSYV
jgi:hypothetical protein